MQKQPLATQHLQQESCLFCHACCSPDLYPANLILHLSKCILWSDRIAARLSKLQAGCYAVRPHNAFVETEYGWQVCKSGSGIHGRQLAAVAPGMLLTFPSPARLLAKLSILPLDVCIEGSSHNLLSPGGMSFCPIESLLTCC